MVSDERKTFMKQGRQKGELRVRAEDVIYKWRGYPH